MISAAVVILATFAIAFASAFVPLVSIEGALLVAAATATSGRLLVAQVLVAAAGQMFGKSCFFVGGRAAFGRARHRDRSDHAARRRRLAVVIERAGSRRAVACATVVVSAVTGLPPFALVSTLAGGWHLRLRAFFVLGFAGRSARFGAILLVPAVVGA